MSHLHQVVIRAVPEWLDWRRLLGPGDWKAETSGDGKLVLSALLERHAAADLAVRLRGVGIGGSRIGCEVVPPLKRGDWKKANTEEARRQRRRSKGFLKPGVLLDEEGRVSLTAESLALDLGRRAGGGHVIDAFAGAGGNAIGFARAGCRVTAIEIDPERLSMARNNARVYGVSKQIDFLLGDAVEVLREVQGDLLFLDPPWGISYNRERVAMDELPPCRDALRVAAHIPRVWIKVPPSFDPSSLPDYAVEAVFGDAEGDRRRVKFLLLSNA